MTKPHILVNLPEGFYRTASLRPVFARLGRLGTVRKRSHNTPEEIAADLAWADFVLMWSWPVLGESLLDQAPRLRYVAHLDVSQAGARTALARGLPVSVARAAFSPAVSEMALTLILACLRKVSDYHAAMRDGREKWVASFPDNIDPMERELADRTVGIVGFGRIGRGLAALLAPFGCRVLAVDPFVPAAAVRKAGARRVTLEACLRSSDIVVLAAASNPGTRHLIGRRQVAALRKGSLLVNVARAALVDTDALIRRLRKGDMAAAIDVFNQEPLPSDHPLRRLPNAYLTPHRAGGTMGSVNRILTWLIDDTEAFVAGRPLRYPLTEAMTPALDA